MAQRFQLDLQPDEIEALDQIVATGSQTRARRARIILMTAQRVPQVTIAADIGLSERQVRRWQRSFQKRRMAIFGSRPRPQSAPRQPRAQSAPTPNLKQGAPPMPGPAEHVTPVEVAGPVDVAEAVTPEEARPGVDAPRRALLLKRTPGVLPTDPMSEAGRKVMYFHLERMLLNEPGSRLGTDIEAVHDMRVATRRLRSALRIFKAYYKPKAIAPILDGLRATAGALGTVRDLDVFIDRLERYQAGLGGEGNGLAPLIEVCEADREAARATLIAHLDSPAFACFVNDFVRFTTTSGQGALKNDATTPAAYQVRHVVPRLIYTRYEAVRTYELVLDRAAIATLHALRIEGKRLRYTLEFFEEVLGPEIKQVIQFTKKFQDHLGDLNDAEVAGDLLRDFIARHEQTQAAARITERRSIEQVVQYMAYQYAEKHRLMTTFPQTWQAFNALEIREALALAVAAL